MRLKRGSVIEFHYNNNDPDKQRIGKVLSVRDTVKEPIQLKSRGYSDVRRSRYLVKCAMADGTYRQFYTEGLTEIKRVGIIRRTLLHLAGVRFGETSHSKVVEMGKVGFGRD